MPVSIFEPFSRDYFTDGTFAFIPHFEEGLRAYRARRFDEAVAHFERTLHLKPEDKPSMIYIERCQILKASPPADDWDGVWTMSSK